MQSMRRAFDPPEVVARALERALNLYLELDPEAARGLERIAGKRVLLAFVGVNLEVCLIPGDGQIRVTAPGEAEPDTVIAGYPWALAQMVIRGGTRGALFDGEVRMRGDMDTGQVLREVLRAVEIDWEELLSGLVGDIAAHQLGNVVRHLRTWAARTGESLRQDVSDYLQEESRVLPTRIELNAFLDEVDTLRNDVDRLAARIEHLAKRTR